MKLSSNTLLLSLAAPISATTSARIWAHFYPECPSSDHQADMESHHSSGQTSHEFDIQANSCQGISVSSVPHHRLQDVNHVSIDADVFWSEPFDRCNITVHEIPNCMDPPLIEKEIQHGKGVSDCAERRFSPFDQVWVKLNCEETGEHHRVAHYYRPASINTTHVPMRNETMGRVASVSAISHSRPMQKPGKKRVSRGLSV